MMTNPTVYYIRIDTPQSPHLYSYFKWMEPCKTWDYEIWLKDEDIRQYITRLSEEEERDFTVQVALGIIPSLKEQINVERALYWERWMLDTGGKCQVHKLTKEF